MSIGVTLDNSEYALLGDHFLADHARRGRALLRGYVRRLLLDGAAAGTQCSHPVWHFPEAVLIRYQHVVVAPGQSVGSVEAFGVTLNPVGLAIAVLVAQQREIANLLLGHEDVAVWQHQQAARMLQSAGEQCCRESFGYAKRLTFVRKCQRPVAYHRPGPRRRKIFRLDCKAPAEFLIGERGGIRGLAIGYRLLRGRILALRPGGREGEAHHRQRESGDAKRRKLVHFHCGLPEVLPRPATKSPYCNQFTACNRVPGRTVASTAKRACHGRHRRSPFPVRKLKAFAWREAQERR